MLGKIQVLVKVRVLVVVLFLVAGAIGPGSGSAGEKSTSVVVDVVVPSLDMILGLGLGLGSQRWIRDQRPRYKCWLVYDGDVELGISMVHTQRKVQGSVLYLGLEDRR